MKIVLPLLTSCLMSSCTTYQVMTVSSPVAQQNKSSEFIIDNDSLEISYNFNGQNGPIRMQIRNKLEKPCYVDWKRSALVVNDRAISYAAKTIEINGDLSGSSYSITRRYSVSNTELHATAEIPSDMDFLPPQAYVVRYLPAITNQPVEYLPDSIFTKKKLPATGAMENQIVETVKVASFTAETSPLVFKSYLTFMIGDTLAKPVAYQHNFYISELVKTSMSPEMLNGDTRGDRFYVVGRADTDNVNTGYGVVKGAASVPPAARKGIRLFLKSVDY